MSIEVFVPGPTVSVANRREHWAQRARRTKSERMCAAWAVIAAVLGEGLGPMPYVVTLTRCAPRALDDDNLRGALKAIRDGVADALKVDDRDPRVTWAYGQEKAPGRLAGVRVAIRRADEAEARPGASSCQQTA